MARILFALATALLVAGCTSSGTDTSASRSSARTSATSTTTAAASTSDGGSATTASGTATSSSAVTSAPSLPPNGAVARSSYSDAGGVWPLTVPNGSLSCQFGSQVLFRAPDGEIYGVNDAARAAGEWKDITAIRADDPKHPGQKLPLDDLIASGMALC